MKIKKTVTITFTQQEAMDLRSLLYIASDAMGAGDCNNTEELRAFRDELLDKSYL